MSLVFIFNYLVGGESHYQFVHDCLSISKSEVSTVLGVLLDDFWWPCEFVSKSNSDTDTHKVFIFNLKLLYEFLLIT